MKKAVLIFLALCLFLCGCGSQKETPKIANGTRDFLTKLEYCKGFEIPANIPDDYDCFMALPTHFVALDSDYLGIIFDDTEISAEDLAAAIENNAEIPDTYRPLLIDFCNAYVSRCPEADRRVLYHNMQTLQIEETDSLSLSILTMTAEGVSGSYCVSTNQLYVLYDHIFEKGTWGYQVLYHELCHAAKQYFHRDNEIGIIYEVCSGGNLYSGILLEEMLNTVFSVSLLDYEELDLAYQFYSNMMSVILECMDNYSLADYINHSQSYFIKCLNEHTGKNNAAEMMDLMELMRNDYIDESQSNPQTRYYPLYDYVADIYFRDHITPGMSSSEALAVADELVKRISYDVPEEYPVDWSRFSSHAEQFLRSLQKSAA